MARAHIGLGSNLGDRRANLERALAMLQAAAGVTVRAVSSFVETEPVGGPPQRTFLNAATELETALDPHPLLDLLLQIEDRMGRPPRADRQRWGPRVIDLDLLLYEDRIVALEDLQVPHPRMHERLFVLQPLAEIAPGAVHPRLGRTVEDLYEEVRIHHRGTHDTEEGA